MKITNENYQELYKQAKKHHKDRLEYFMEMYNDLDNHKFFEYFKERYPNLTVFSVSACWFDKKITKFDGFDIGLSYFKSEIADYNMLKLGSEVADYLAKEFDITKEELVINFNH